MKSKIHFWAWLLCLGALSTFALWNCNVSDPEEVFFLRVAVNDSLTVEAGKYDTLEVDLLDTSGNVVQKHLFFAPYFRADSLKLAKLALTAKPPEPFVVRITAQSKTTNEAWVFTNKVVNGSPQPQSLALLPEAPTGEVAPGKVTILSPASKWLYVKDTVALLVDFDNAKASKAILWSVSNLTHAEIISGNKITGLTPGEFVLKATSALSSNVSDSLRITVLPTPTSFPQSVVIANPNPLIVTVDDASIALNASVLPDDARQTVVWTLPPSDLAILEFGNRIKGLKPGNVKVTASSSIALTVFAVLDVTISAGAEPESIAVNMPVPVFLAPSGSTSDILWTVYPTGVGQGMTWTSSDTNIAQVTPDNKIKSGILGKAIITGTSKVKASITKQFEVQVVKPVKVDAITLSPKTLRLYSGGADSQLTVTLVGNDSGAKYTLTSSNATVASVKSSGAVQGLKSGIAQITATVVGDSSKTSVCSVAVVTDTPRVSVTPNQAIAYGGEASFKVSVTQQYGTVAEIKADMDGNGSYEQVLLAMDSVTFRATYSQVKVFDVAFQVKDSEGNIVDIARTVTVAAPAAPTVKIVDPASAITVNTASYTVKFTVKDPTKAVDEAKDSVVTLTGGPNTIRVSRSNAGGTGSAQVVITLDQTAPGTPVLTAQPAFTADNTPTWSWGAIVGAAKYQVRLDDSSFAKPTGTLDVTVTTYTSGALTEGRHTLFVRSVDALGNASSSASQSLTVDTRAPDAVRFTGIDSSYTTSLSPTWAWTPSSTNGGTGVYVLKLDAGVEFDWASTTFSPTTALSDNAMHTLTVKEKDQVEGVTGPAKSFSYRVKVNPPAIPNVKSAANVANNGLTNNPRFTWTSGGGGNGKYRVRINTESAYRTHPQTGGTQTAWSLDTTDLDGTYAIHVSEQDEMGRWGAEGHFTIQLDRTGPVYTEVQLFGTTTVVREGYITNVDTLFISYKSDGVTKQFGCRLAIDNGLNTCSVANTDAVGNPSTLTRHIWRRSNVVFFTTTGQGSKDGSSWENARGDLVDFVNLTKGAAIDGKDLWIASGDYSAKLISTDQSWFNIYGGFNASAYPTDLNSRVNFSTTLGQVSLFRNDSCVFDGLTIKGLTTFTNYLKFRTIRFMGPISIISALNVNFVGCELIDVDGTDNAVLSIDGKIDWDGGKITGNNPVGSYYPIEITSSSTSVVSFKGNLTISGNGNTNIGSSTQIHNTGNLTVEKSVTIDCGTIFNDGGTGSCKGTGF